MPISTADVFEAVLNKELRSQVPEPADWAAAQATGASADLQARWTETSAELWQGAAQQLLAGVTTNVGIPIHQIAFYGKKVLTVFNTVREAMGEEAINVIELAGEAISQSNLAQSLGKSGAAIAGEVSSAIPILGAVVGLVLSFVDLAKQVAAKQDAQRKVIFDPASFSAELDTTIYRTRVLGKIENSSDWTEIWSPPTWAERINWLKEDLKGGGVRVKIGNPAGSALGIVPGTDWLNRGFELFDVGGRRPIRAFDPGRFWATAQQQGTWIWGVVNRVGPSMFTVDANASAERWEHYLWSLREWLAFGDHRPGDKWGRGLVDDLNVMKAFDWAPWMDPKQIEERRNRGRSGTLRDPYGAARARPVREAKALRERQIAALDTLTVAYVDPSFKALEDAELRTKWEQRRRDLLEHRARFDVDLENVPDDEYRAELAARGVTRMSAVTGATKLAIEGKIKRPKGGKGLVLGSGGEYEPSPGPSPAPIVSVAGRPPRTRRESSTIASVLGIAAIGAIAYVGLRRAG